VVGELSLGWLTATHRTLCKLSNCIGLLSLCPRVPVRALGLLCNGRRRSGSLRRRFWEPSCGEAASSVSVGTGAVVHRSAKWYGDVSMLCLVDYRPPCRWSQPRRANCRSISLPHWLDNTTEIRRESCRDIGIKTCSVQLYFAGGHSLFASAQAFLRARSLAQ
jgi:hypothetical protein